MVVPFPLLGARVGTPLTKGNRSSRLANLLLAKTDHLRELSSTCLASSTERLHGA